MVALDVSDGTQLPNLVGQAASISAWVTIEQDRINRFAAISGDHQWIHLDVERSAIESPYGRTIAHGNLLLIIAADLSRTMLTFSYASRIVNYGFDRIRFLTPVPSGARVRLSQLLTQSEQRGGGATRIVISLTLELEGAESPALVADSIKLIYP